MAFDTAKTETIEELEEILDGVGPTLARQLLAEHLRSERRARAKQRRRGQIVLPDVEPETNSCVLAAFAPECVYCQRRGDLDLDFLVPYRRGGQPVPLNLVPACAHCRASRRTKHLDVWLTRRRDLDKAAIYKRLNAAAMRIQLARHTLRRAA